MPVTTSAIYQHVPHPRIAERKAQGPVKTLDVRKGRQPGASAAQRFNSALGLAITNGVGTMWAAYVFACIALLSLPAVLAGVFPAVHRALPSWLIGASLIALVGWISSYFLQLVLLPIIIVGQNIQGRAADARSEATYKDADAVLHEAEEIQKHLAAQDAAISDVLAQVSALRQAG